MFGPGIFYLLVSVVLFAVAVVVHFNSLSLSLPISPAISILVAILPIAGFLNAYIHPSTLYTSHHQPPSPSSSSSPSPSARLLQLAPFVLQTLQALITAILATLLLERTVPSPSQSCILEGRWAESYRTHDADAIRTVQDALSCCGLNSLRDRAYPFQRDGAPSTCAETYGRDAACRDPWARAMRTNAGVDLGVVLAVGLLQILGLLMMREGKNWWTAWRVGRWAQAMGERGSRRPLLTGLEEVDEEQADATARSNDERGRQGYGSTGHEGDGPRVEPSTIHERNAWDEH
ncbi:hypothetical protein ACO1O0_006424 [Amphichorda felina]